MPKVEIIKPEAIVDLQIGSQFLKDLQSVILYLSTFESTDRIKDVVAKANAEQPLDEWEQSLYTMLVLVTTIEENARKAGLTSIEDIPEEGISPE
jgi:hypothetical protein